MLFDEDFAAGRPYAGATSKFRSSLLPWSNLLCITTQESALAAYSANAGAARSFGVSDDILRSVADSIVPPSSRKGGRPNLTFRPAQGGRGQPGGGAPRAPAAVGQSGGLKNLLRQPIGRPAAEPSSAPAAAAPAGQSPVLTSSRAPASLGGFRIIQRVGAEPVAPDASSSSPQAAAVGKPATASKHTRKSDGSGLKALEAAALGLNEQKPAEADEEPAAAAAIMSSPAAASAAEGGSEKSDSQASNDKSRELLSVLRRPATGSAVDPPPPPPAEEAGRGDADAGQRLLSLIKPKQGKQEGQEAVVLSGNAAGQSLLAALQQQPEPKETQSVAKSGEDTSAAAVAPKKSALVPAAVLKKKSTTTRQVPK